MKRYIVGKIVEKDGQKVLDGVTMSRKWGILGTGIFVAGLVTIFKKGKEIGSKVATKLHLNDKLEKVKAKINF